MIEKNEITKILFVCSGNICRSPIAEHYCQFVVNNKGISNKYFIDSAGTMAEEGQLPTKYVIEILEKEIPSIKNHRSKSIYSINIEEFDYVFVMTQSHKEQIEFSFPKLKEKIYLLKQFTSTNKDIQKDIDDPWGYDKIVYENCFKEIKESIDKLINII